MTQDKTMSTDKANILVVDDVSDKLVVYRSILESPEHNVVVAHSGTDALKQVLQQEFAVILLDVHMPDLDGFETATLIRSRKRSAHTPIIFITAMLDEVRAVEGYAHGGVDYILAPVVPEILRAKVKVFVDLFRMHQELKRQAEVQVALAAERARREAAEETDRRKDEFLAMLAHELRNPLAPIRNASHMLRLMLHRHDPELTQLQDMIDRQLGNLTRLVDDLLDVSRITSGKIRLNLEPIDLALAAATAIETSRPLIDARKQELKVSLPAGPVPVLGDQTRLSQVLSNLLNNAAKYTPEGGHISLMVSCEDAEVICRVCDDGVGIDPAMLPTIFDLFIQAEQSMDRAQGGLGIGLTLARQLVDMHNGTLEATSPGPGHGSEFIVRLPLAAMTTERAPVRKVIPSCKPSSDLRILVVDDNKDAAQSLAMVLQVEGYKVCTANDGASALRAFTEFSPDAVFLDLGLPGMDGYTVARRLREQDPSTDLLLIAVTGYGSDVDKSRSRAAGFNHHLIKPVDFAELQRLLEEKVAACAADAR
jgi:signal transduction histidine kinase